MAELTIRADELIMAFEDQGSDMRHFFDRQTGEVLTGFEDMDEEDALRLDAEPDRYLLIEPVPSWVGYEIMSDFVETLPEGEARRELARALQQRQPFRRFKDLLLSYPSVREDWFRFHEQAFMKIIKEWLDDHGVEATLVPFHAPP
ncbi:MAG: hypothetical protein A2139_07955 [Desulfobacca sp. RBG_16_60_12]|nr:MAG: hypothetical protein A2139_07955 [Desulfobacca sp. RBG_16_60_12]